MPDRLERLEELARAVDAWRGAKCQRRCEDCDPSFGCFAGGRVLSGERSRWCRKPGANYCDGANHVEGCPVELALQDVLEASNQLQRP